MPALNGLAAALLPLLSHLHTIVGGRDRTFLNGALLQALRDLLHTSRVSLVRVITHNGFSFFLPAGTVVGHKLELRDAYLLSPQHGHPLAGHARYQQCCDTAQPLHTLHDDGHHYLYPLLQHDRPYALLELERPTPLGEEEITLLSQLLGLFLDHLSLIEYAETDTLTGLLNRKTFDENLNRILANVGNDDTLLEQHPYPHRRHARKAGVSNWLAVADIDHFKRINDTHGHIIGDEVLLLVAQFMRQSFRFDDQLFRFGGEEFVTVLQPAGQGDAFTVLERFRTKIETHDFPIVGQLTISIGFTRIDGLDSPTELVGRADQALYFAKQSGRNRVESYEDLLAAGLIVDNLPHKTDIELF
jgi:diguanylate cyclase (GGDEF)-like protein